MKSAEDWARELDGVHDLAAATRLARAIGDPSSIQESLERMLDLADRYLGAEDPPVGIVLRALEHVAGEPGCPDRVDDLLERAAAAWPDARRKDDLSESC